MPVPCAQLLQPTTLASMTQPAQKKYKSEEPVCMGLPRTTAETLRRLNEERKKKEEEKKTEEDEKKGEEDKKEHDAAHGTESSKEEVAGLDEALRPLRNLLERLGDDDDDDDDDDDEVSDASRITVSLSPRPKRPQKTRLIDD